MKLRLNLSALFLLAAVTAAPAQSIHPKTFDRLSGTLTMSANGIATRANLQWQAPDSLRIEIQPDEAALIDAQTIVASGSETRLYAPGTRRVKRLPYNITQQPWRGWDIAFGGPANVALFGTTVETISKAYQPAANAPANVKPFTALSTVGRYFVRDGVRTGGGGDSMYYAAYKHWIFDRPATWQLGVDPATKFITSRRELDEKGRVIADIALTYAPDGLPQKATARDANAVVAEFTYDLKPQTEPFAANTFQLDVPVGQIIEDDELRPIAEYAGRDDAAAHFNRGVALAAHAEDFPAAFAAWNEAAKLAPQAVAPVMATFDAALITRSFAFARNALDTLSRQFGADHTQVLSRRASLAAAQRDWDAARAALDTARKANPGNHAIALLQANALRLQGDFAGAQQILLEVLAGDKPQIVAQTNAAEALAAIASREEAPKLLESLPKTTPAQQLARALLAISIEQEPEGDTKSWPDGMVASLALARERAGQDDAARPLWQLLSDRAPQPTALAARRHLMAIIARKGAVADSLKLFKDLLSWTSGDSDRSELENEFFTAWNKADRIDVLKTALQQRALATAATPDDRRLWQIYLENFGTPDEALTGLNAGLAREPNSPWWLSRLAERKMWEADAPLADDNMAVQQKIRLRQNAMRDALKAADAAVAAAPDQPYYHIQRALILTQTVVKMPQGSSTSDLVASRKAALTALEELRAKFPGDPDVDIAVALQQMSATKAGDALKDSIALLRNALQAGNPGRDSTDADRHEAAFPARQMLAIALRRAAQPKEASTEFEVALQSARSATEAVGIAVNVLNLWVDQKQPAMMAAFLTRIVREPWPFSDAGQLLDTSVAAVLRFPELAGATAQILTDSDDPYAKIAVASMREKMALRARNLALRDNAPVQADAAAQAAMREWSTTLQALPELASGNDHILAARAAAMLGENEGNRQGYDNAIKWLSLAATKEPQDLNLRVALANAQLAGGDAKSAAATRDAMLHTLPLTFDTLRQAAILTRRLQQKAEAVRLLRQAYNWGLVTPGVGAFDTKTVAFQTARALFDNAQVAHGLEIYNTLAGPTRPPLERAAALIDAEARLRASGSTREADRIVERLRALNIKREDLQTAANFLATLE